MISFKNMRQFEVDLDDFAKKIGATRKAVFQKATLDIWNGITLKTPVATGRARSSWNVAVGNPDPSIPPEGERGMPAPPDVKRVDGNQVVWITSNLPYIEPLEHGHSQQAPNGMVTLTIAEFLAEIQLYNEQSLGTA